jgi:DNA-binding GntR family transcriptional regulator
VGHARTRRADRSSVQSEPGRETQRAQAYDLLRRELLLRRIREGERLRELYWSRRLGVNRTALREALARLLSEGLVVEGEKTGYFVPELSETDRQEILEVRLMAEFLATDRLARTPPPRRIHLQPLYDLCDELEWLLGKRYAVDLGEADYRFHQQLVESCSNRRLSCLHRCLPQLAWLQLGLGTRAGNLQGWEVLREHRLILEAIEAGDASRARDLLERHLNPTAEDKPSSE